MPVNWQDKVTPVDAQNLGIMQDDITEVQTNVDNLEEDMNTKFADVEEEISDKVSTLETSLEAEIEEKYAEVTENVKTNTTNISDLQSSVESINTQIDDLNDFFAMGTTTLKTANIRYGQQSDGSYMTVHEAIEKYWENLEPLSIYIAYVQTNMRWAVIIQTYADLTYGSYLALGYGSPRLSYRRLSNGTWHDPVTLV